MKKQELITKIKSILRECLMDNDIEIAEEAHLVNDLGLDSMGFVDLTVKLEGEFDIEIPDDESRAIQTFEQVLQLVVAKLNAKDIAVLV